MDTYFFPIAFLYRHILELILKAIITLKYITDLEQSRQFVKDSFHNLSEILTTIEPFIGVIAGGKRDDFLWLQDHFKNMNNIDRDSDSFRYPFSLSLKRDEDPFGEGTKVFAIRPFFEEKIRR